MDLQTLKINGKYPTAEEMEKILSNEPIEEVPFRVWDSIYDIFFRGMANFYDKNQDIDKKVKRHNRYLKQKESLKR